MRLRNIFNQTTMLVLGLIWLLIASTPFYFMASTGLKGQYELFGRDSVFALPNEPSLDNYQQVLEDSDFLSYMKNSTIIVSASVILILLFSSMAAYVFARFKFKLNRPLFLLIIAGLVIPLHATLIPVYLLTQEIGLYDKLWALLGPYVAFNLPLSIFILTEFMRQIPREIEEAARMDGANPIRIFFRIILPLSTPGLATLTIYNAVVLWNEFVFSFILITSRSGRTLPLAIWEYQGQYAMNIPAIMSVLTLSAIPLIAVYIIGQERVLRGMMAGALK